MTGAASWRASVLLVLLAPGHARTREISSRAGIPEVAVELVAPDVLTSIAPVLRVRATRTASDPQIVALGVRVALTPFVLNNPVLDTSTVASDSVDIRVAPLPSGATVYLRGYARTSTGTIVYSPPTTARLVPTWLNLVFPGAQSGAIIEDQQPTFRWKGAEVSSPPGPWVYTFSLVHTAGGPPIHTMVTQDTTLPFPFPLELNTSYRWSVIAQLLQRPNTSLTLSSSFVIVDQSTPRATLLYQTFPNPFPSTLRRFACIWFDLSQPSSIVLDVLDIRSNPVKRIYPAPGAPNTQLPAGRYGRAVNSEAGCTGEFTWDGTDAAGRKVIPGVYLLRLRASGRQFVRPVGFRG